MEFDVVCVTCVCVCVLEFVSEWFGCVGVLVFCFFVRFCL